MWHPVTSGVFPPGCVRLDAAEKSDRSVFVGQMWVRELRRASNPGNWSTERKRRDHLRSQLEEIHSSSTCCSWVKHSYVNLGDTVVDEWCSPDVIKKKKKKKKVYKRYIKIYVWSVVPIWEPIWGGFVFYILIYEKDLFWNQSHISIHDFEIQYMI